MTKSVSALSKPDKIWLHNTTLSHAISPNNTKIGYLKQDLDFEDGKTILEDAQSAFKEIIELEQKLDQFNKENPVQSTNCYTLST